MDDLKVVKLDVCKNDEWICLGDISNSYIVESTYKILLPQNALQSCSFSAFNFDFFFGV